MTNAEQIIARFKSKTPAFFLKVRRFGLWLTGACTASRVALAKLPDQLPIFFDEWLGYGICIGTVIIIFSKFPTSDKEISEAITPKELAKEIKKEADARNDVSKV